MSSNPSPHHSTPPTPSEGAMELYAIWSERNNALRECNMAVAQRRLAMADRDIAILERDAALIDRDNARMQRDNAIARLQLKTNLMNASSGMMHNQAESGVIHNPSESGSQAESVGSVSQGDAGGSEGPHQQQRHPIVLEVESQAASSSA